MECIDSQAQACLHAELRPSLEGVISPRLLWARSILFSWIARALCSAAARTKRSALPWQAWPAFCTACYVTTSGNNMSHHILRCLTTISHTSTTTVSQLVYLSNTVTSSAPACAGVPTRMSAAFHRFIMKLIHRLLAHAVRVSVATAHPLMSSHSRGGKNGL